MKRLKTFGTVLFTTVLLAALPGCEKEGPAEQAGKEVDKAMQEAGDKLEQAGEDIKEAASDK
ncbi:hypothetical protein A8C75_09600 [Marinobacterium aestuarii]|uniref:Cathelicidin antimicrobial peptide C-terminal domain-containing protein n=1 Tax=Marinobacterium aestuarii TaxID=1821621 RepID=A0A1A9EY14_9GAMM|nr:hypothetical protein [Marinobacterium aestuarii]ANG62712.1 hypothetical protein A8C75_09600 [Marinobacterium aestuarii]